MVQLTVYTLVHTALWQKQKRLEDKNKKKSLKNWGKKRTPPPPPYILPVPNHQTTSISQSLMIVYTQENMFMQTNEQPAASTERHFINTTEAVV